MNVIVRVDATAVRRALSGLSAGTSRRALTRALNEAVDGGRTEATRLVRADLNLKARTVRESIRVRKALGSLTTGEIIIEPHDVPLIEYAARPVKAGVTFQVKVRGRRQTIRRAFIATMKSGHTSVFTRFQKAGGKSGRLPIRKLFSSSVRQFFKRKRVVEQVKQHAAQRFNIEALRQIRLAQRRARA